MDFKISAIIFADFKASAIIFADFKIRRFCSYDYQSFSMSSCGHANTALDTYTWKYSEVSTDMVLVEVLDL